MIPKSQPESQMSDDKVHRITAREREANRQRDHEIISRVAKKAGEASLAKCKASTEISDEERSAQLQNATVNRVAKILAPRILDREIESDWTLVATPQDLEEQLGDFKFKGEGWYPSKRGGDWLLVTEHNEAGKVFKAYVYNGRDPRSQMQRVATLPVF